MIPLLSGDCEGSDRIRRNNSGKYYGKIPIYISLDPYHDYRQQVLWSTSRRRSIFRLRLVRQGLSHSFLMSSLLRRRRGNLSAAAVEFGFKSREELRSKHGTSYSRLVMVTHLPDHSLASMASVWSNQGDGANRCAAHVYALDD